MHVFDRLALYYRHDRNRLCPILIDTVIFVNGISDSPVAYGILTALYCNIYPVKKCSLWYIIASNNGR